MEALPAIVARAVDIRRDIHRHPELGYEEHRTADVVRRELDRLGVAWRACAGTGSVAVLAPRARGRRIAFRCDLDALPMQEHTGLPWASAKPNHMHACGHDGHTASLLAAAAYLKGREADLPGPVTLLFQPAEERGAGARKMVEEGAVAEVDEVYGYHNWPPLAFGKVACIPGPLMGANGELDIAITGRGGHASTPHECRDPVVAAANYVQMLQQVISRQRLAIDAGVLSITAIEGGGAYNVIPERVTMRGSVRGITTGVRDDLAKRAETMAHAVAAASGCTATFSHRPLYPATVNDPACAAKAAAAVERVFGAGSIHTAGLPIMGSEDFSFFLQAKPGCYLLVGAGRPGATIEPCHSPRFDFNDDLIPRAVRLWADLAGVPVAD